MPLKGNAPINGYAFFLWNRPHYPEPDQYLRVVVAPTYLLTELVQDHWPFGRHAVSVGLNGGGLRYGHDEYRNGNLQGRRVVLGPRRRAAALLLRGHEALRQAPAPGPDPPHARLHRLPGLLRHGRPLRAAPGHRAPHRSSGTPPRAGVPPELLPQLALEASAWYEAVYRTNADTFGFPERPGAPGVAHPARLGPSGRRSSSPPRGTPSTSWSPPGSRATTDLLSSYPHGQRAPLPERVPADPARLLRRGGVRQAVLAAERVVPIPGLAGLRNVHLRISGDIAGVEYVDGHRLPREHLRGVGADVSIAITPRVTVVGGLRIRLRRAPQRWLRGARGSTP